MTVKRTMGRSGPLIALASGLVVLCVVTVIGLAAIGSGIFDAPGDTPVARATRVSGLATVRRDVAPQSGTPERNAPVPGATVPLDGGDAASVVSAVGPAVVTVIDLQRAGLQGDGVSALGRGTGFVIDDRGHILTSSQVAVGGDEFRVLFADGEARPAVLVGADPVSDLAVVRVRGGVPAVAPLGDSDRVATGQAVLAIGSPLGTFSNSVTRGIVSALGRTIEESGVRPERAGLIQHDAAINEGNAGGPLLDLAGQVIGVNTLGLSTAGAGDPVQGIFFAIPVNTARTIAERLIADGAVVYPSLGIDYQPVTAQIASKHGLPVSDGVFVVSVRADGPASQAGIRRGDIVVEIGGQAIDATHAFSQVLLTHRPGERVKTAVRRGAEEFEVEVVLGERAG